MRVHAILAVLSIAMVLPGVCHAGVLSRKQIEADWMRQAQLRIGSGLAQVTPVDDAAGGVDGVKNGKWGFHTLKEENPWWKVDLGKITRIGKVVLYNRTELAERNSKIILLLSENGRQFRRIYQHDGSVFYGYEDGKPLTVELNGPSGRYLRLQLPGTNYFHLDEVEVYGVAGDENLALNRPATQSSVSQWSKMHSTGEAALYDVKKIAQRGLKLAAGLTQMDVDTNASAERLREIAAVEAKGDKLRRLYFEARWIVREMALSNPLLNFDKVLFVKRVPPAFPHMSDQYYGWWSRAGGGIYVLEGFKSETPRVRCLTEGFPVGSFLRPDISADGKRVIFAYCRFYEDTHKKQKADKNQLAEDVFYHIYEMGIESGWSRRLTRGKYDDFDCRYLPDGDIVFLSTRKGRHVQITLANTAATMQENLPDSYVRCGGDNWRPVPVFTLHRMDADGGGIRPISAFENFEWTPAIANDGRILYARWDYIDRFNGPFISLWSANQNGTNSQLVYGNYTSKPQCVFEPRPIPNSTKVVFTAAAHHSNMGGSLVLLDRTKGTEYERPLSRLTPEVCFPETEGWPQHYYSNPYPLSEEYFLVTWSDKPLPPHTFVATEDRNPANAQGIYLYDAFGNLELLYRDENISSMYPLPIRTVESKPVHPDTIDWDDKQQGCFLVQDIYRGLVGVQRGTISSLRIVGVPPKVQPHMNQPSLGVSREDPGKFILGTVPVEADGSAYFRAPSGIPVFFQVLDKEGFAVQTMRTLTYVGAGQTLSCIGCHESRDRAPATLGRPMAIARGPSKIQPGSEGTWPLRFDRLVQPFLNSSCVSCHRAESGNDNAAKFELTADKSYANLMAYADKDLEKLAFEKDASVVGQCVARNSKLLKVLTENEAHKELKLDDEQMQRLVTWMDVYAQRLGSFSAAQEQELLRLRRRLAALFEDN